MLWCTYLGYEAYCSGIVVFPAWTYWLKEVVRILGEKHEWFWSFPYYDLCKEKFPSDQNRLDACASDNKQALKSWKALIYQHAEYFVSCNSNCRVYFNINNILKNWLILVTFCHFVLIVLELTNFERFPYDCKCCQNGCFQNSSL